MADPVIGAVRVVVGADTAQLDTGLKGSQKKLAEFGTAVAAGFAAAAAAAVAAGTAIGVAMSRTIDDMDKLSKTSQKLGVPIEQLSALSYAADLSDVSFESLSKSVAKLSKTMVEAAAKPTSEAANAFRALGVSVKEADGSLKSSDTVLAEVAEKFSGLKDGAGKTAASIAIFGRSGADLIPLLNGGRDGLKEMSDEASKFGIIVDSKAGKAAEAFNDNLTRLKAAWNGIIVQASAQVLPSMVAITDALVATAKNSGILATALTVVGTAIKGLVSAGVIVGAVFKTLAEYISTVSSAMALVLKGQFTAAWEAVKGGVSSVGETATTTFGIIDRLWRGAQDGAEGAAGSADKAAKSQKEFNYAAMGGKNAIDQFIDSQNKSLVSQQAEIQTFGMLAGQKEAARLQLQALTIATQNHTTISAAQQAQLDLTKQKTIEYAQTLAGLQMAQSNLTPAQIFQQEQLKIQALFDAGKLSAEAYGQAMDNAAERANATWGQASASIAGSFATISGAFGKESSAMATAAKVFGVIQGTISMFTGAAKALELPFPANIAAVAAVLAKGASLVASIKSQSVPTGYAAGGFVSGPGTGTSDSIPAMLSDGEFVMNADATRRFGPELEAMNSGRSVTPARSVTLQGFMWGRDQMTQLFEFLNEGMRDGHKLDLKFA